MSVLSKVHLPVKPRTMSLLFNVSPLVSSIWYLVDLKEILFPLSLWDLSFSQVRGALPLLLGPATVGHSIGKNGVRHRHGAPALDTGFDLGH